MAILRLAFKFAIRFLVYVPTQVIHDEQVEEPIVVYVNPGGSNRPERPVLFVRLRETGFCRDIGESPVAIIVVKRISIDATHKNVFVSIIVIIANCDTYVETAPLQASPFGNVGESSIAIVVEESVPVFLGVLLQSDNVRAVREEDVRPAVAVVVENGNSSRHGLGSVPLRRLGAI